MIEANLPNVNLSGAACKVISDVLANDYNAISYAENATATAGADIITSFTDNESRLTAQNNKYEHDERQTKTREMHKTLRCSCIVVGAVMAVGLIIGIPAYLKSTVSA